MNNNKLLVLEPKENGATYDIVPFENDLKQIQELVDGYEKDSWFEEIEQKLVSINGCEF